MREKLILVHVNDLDEEVVTVNLTRNEIESLLGVIDSLDSAPFRGASDPLYEAEAKLSKALEEVIANEVRGQTPINSDFNVNLWKTDGEKE